jgi:hypothetical protein
MKTMKEILTPASILLLAGVALFDHLAPHLLPAPAPAPAPSVEGVVLGKAYAPVLLSTYGDAWQGAAKTLEAGKTVAEAQETLQGMWKEGRVKAFTDHVASSFSLVLPEGVEPTTPEKRAQVVKLWRDFARGLNGGR